MKSFVFGLKVTGSPLMVESETMVVEKPEFTVIDPRNTFNRDVATQEGRALAEWLYKRLPEMTFDAMLERWREMRG